VPRARRRARLRCAGGALRSGSRAARGAAELSRDLPAWPRSAARDARARPPRPPGLNKTYDIQLFHNANCDASAYGEGRTLLATESVTTDGAGNAQFLVNVASGLTTGFITAVATDVATGDSSEFSPCAELAVPASPKVKIFGVTVTEGNAGTKLASFQVRLSAAPGAGSVSVDWDTADDTATDANNDYEPASGTLTFTGTEIEKTVDIVVNGDSSTEADEQFLLNLSNLSGATFENFIGTGHILNDDNTLNLSVNSVAVAEGNAGTTNLDFTVSLSANATYPVSFQYATADGTAVAGVDYTATSGFGSITVGNDSTTVTVPLTGDVTTEPDETFTLTIYAASNAVITTAAGTGTITNDDTEPTVTINDPSVTEGDSGTKSMKFTVTIDHPSSQTISVPFSLADDTANVGVDYNTNGGSFTIVAGATSADVTVGIKGDTTVEPDETFFCNITKPSNASLGDAQGVGTILNDDAEPTPSITVSDVSAAENAGPLTFTLELSPAPTQAGTVTISTAPNTATGVDYDAIALTAVPFAIGQTTIEVDVTLTNDDILEPDETFYLNLHSATNAVVGDSQAIGTITNDDIGPDLAVTKTAPASVTVGVQFDYTITVSNSGGDATGVEVTDELPAGVDYVSASADNGGSCSGTSTVTCTFATLDGGQSATVTITVVPNGVGPINNSASALALQLDTNAANNSDGASSEAALAAPVTVPTMTGWGLLALAAALLAFAIRRM
jgi:uncharacterized repeat protein (TIGR01451 family)